jgi:tetratricopeptide (TPR) repeat protein
VAISSCVEDEYGDSAEISIYNERETINPDELLPIGTIIAVKEPCYKIVANGGYSIRVDHPSDVVYLDPADERVPLAWRTSSTKKVSASEYKIAGNESYAKGRYSEAAELYSKGLAASERDSLLSYDLLRNRAIVHLYLKRFENARSDALSSIIKSSEAEPETKARLDNKAFFRAGRAMYELGDFDAARRAFSDALGLVPSDKAVLAEIARCDLRLAERNNGSYDFGAISRALSSSHASSFDHADFLRNTVMQETSYGGRGLFATKAIKAGELVLCERAFHVAHPVDPLYILININTGHGAFGGRASLLFAIIDKLRNNPVAWAGRFLDLHDGGYEPKCTAMQIDGAAVIDTFQVQSIIEQNSFSAPDLRPVKAGSTTGTNKAAETDTETSVGVWMHASRINHACGANTNRGFLGDLMLIHATRDIAAGEEITMRYPLPEADLDKRRDLLKMAWRFTCNCALCSAEVSGTPVQRARLKTLLGTVETFLAKSKMKQRQLANEVLVTGERLYRDVIAAYDTFMPANMPRLGLIDLALWLSQAYTIQGRREPTYQKALEALEYAGFRVIFEQGIFNTIAMHDNRSQARRINVVRSTTCLLDGRAIDAAVVAAHCFFSVGKMAVGKAYQSLALEFWDTACGQRRDYEKKYGRIVA